MILCIAVAGCTGELSSGPLDNDTRRNDETEAEDTLIANAELFDATSSNVEGYCDFVPETCPKIRKSCMVLGPDHPTSQRLCPRLEGECIDAEEGCSPTGTGGTGGSGTGGTGGSATGGTGGSGTGGTGGSGTGGTGGSGTGGTGGTATGGTGGSGTGGTGGTATGGTGGSGTGGTGGSGTGGTGGSGTGGTGGSGTGGTGGSGTGGTGGSATGGTGGSGTGGAGGSGTGGTGGSGTGGTGGSSTGGTGGSGTGGTGGSGTGGTGGSGTGGTGGTQPLAKLFSPARYYSVPSSNRIFVSQTNGQDGASDAAHDSGTPFRTIRAALDYLDSKNRSGWTIVVSEGVYRETLSPQTSGGKPQQRREVFTLQPNGRDEVWMSGSDRVDGQLSRSSSNGYWYADWDRPLCDCGKNACPTMGGNECVVAGIFDNSPPFAARPEMAFIDGEPLRQVGSLSALADDAFYVDLNAGRLYFGLATVNNNHAVEVTRRRTALRSHSNGVRLRGIGFRHYGSEQQLSNAAPAAVLGEQGSNLRIEDCKFVDNASRGVSLVSSENATIVDSEFRRNGFAGMSATYAHNTSILNSFFVGNNAEHFIPSGANGAAAGMKVTRTQGLRVQGNVFEGNHATGLWLDVSCIETTLLGNLVRGNVRHGIYYEMSADAVLASNVFLDNLTGARISGSNNVVLWNNSFESNDKAFSVYEDTRTCPGNCPRQWELDHVDQATWDVADVSVANNLVSSGSTSGSVLLDHAIHGGISATETFSRLDYQTYHRQSATILADMVRWEGSNYDELTAWQSANASLPASIREANAVVLTGASSKPFVNAAKGNYEAKSGLPSTALSGAQLSISAAVNNAPAAAPFESPPQNKAGPWWLPQAAARSATTLSTGEADDLRVAAASSSTLLPVCRYDKGGQRAYAISPHGAASDCSNGSVPTAGSLAAKLWQNGYTNKQGVAFYTRDRGATGLVAVYAMRMPNGTFVFVSTAARVEGLVAAGAVSEGLAFYASIDTGAR